MTIGYTAINKGTKESIEFYAHANLNNGITAPLWIEKHLDQPWLWMYKPNGKFKHDQKQNK